MEINWSFRGKRYCSGQKTRQNLNTIPVR